MGVNNYLRHSFNATMYSPENITRAIHQFLNGSASEEDLEIINDWYYSFDDEEIVINSAIKDLRQQVRDRMKERLQEMLTEERGHIRVPGRVVKNRIRRYYMPAAAVVLLLLGAGLYKKYDLFRQQQPVAVHRTASSVKNDIVAPASSNATLTLADGRKITLDSGRNGSVALQGNTHIVKLSDGALAYDGTGGEKEIMYNILSVPRGSKVVTVKLSDGTQVWLNSESSLRYPVAYAKGEQRIFITGEAYFEVSRDPKRKFIVSAGNTTTEVLGTHFNVNTYSENRAVKVTLLEGSLKVTNVDSDQIINSGQQAHLSDDGRIKINEQVDLEEVMAWKNGLFKFNKEDLQSIMRKIERWYDVEVVYDGEIRTLTFGGVIPRTENASAVLDLLQLTGVVKFRVEPSAVGRTGKITVKM